MKIDVIDVSFSKDKAMMFSKLFANKDPLFDFINFFSVQLIMVTKSLMVKLILKFLSRSGCFAVCYDYEYKVILNLYGMFVL